MKILTKHANRAMLSAAKMIINIKNIKFYEDF